MAGKISIFWFRRDLRIEDNAGLYYALRSGRPVLPIFIFDTRILGKIEDSSDKRVCFIHYYLNALQTELIRRNTSLHVLHGTPLDSFKRLIEYYDIEAVYTNHDYEPHARERDKEISDFLLENGITLYSYKDQVVFEKSEIVKDNNEPYTVFTPYSKKWKATLEDKFYLKSYPTGMYSDNFLKIAPIDIPSLEDIGFKKITFSFPPIQLNRAIARSYNDTRDFPAQEGTTKMSVHLRFGTISIRQLIQDVIILNGKLLDELIWREFYQMILWHYPHVVDTSFKLEYDNIKWRNNESEFNKWCAGKTGYPIVDAGMRELNTTGYMHNRVRMIVASFLTKHLLIDWKWGEAYFAAKLLDYDLASNNGGWQWVAGSGCDAVPYFRIFNPYLQTEKFDPQQEYIRKWIPEINTASYPNPIVEHAYARRRCLEAYKTGLDKK